MMDSKAAIATARAQARNKLTDSYRDGASQYPVYGRVVDVDDPLGAGRVRVFCEALGDDPRNIDVMPWAICSMPVIGNINNDKAVRGTGYSGKLDFSGGAMSYGLWMTPELNAEVIVICMNGSVSERVVTGCLPPHQDVNTFGHGRYIWGKSGLPDGPFTGGPISDDGTTDPSKQQTIKLQPLYDNLSTAFSNDRQSPEWRTRGADLPGLANKSATGNIVKRRDQKVTEIEEALKAGTGPDKKLREHEATRVTEPGYGWSMIRNGFSANRRASRTTGWVTPGGHAITMDDRHGNSRIRLRTIAGTQVIFDDTNERIYMATALGKSWLEMDWNGNIDYHAERRISMHAAKGFNFTTDETFRVHAKKGIHLVAGSSDLADQDQNLPALLPDGQIRLHAQHDLHVYSNENLRAFSGKSTLFSVGQDFGALVQKQFKLASLGDFNIASAKGNLTLNSDQTLSVASNNDVKVFAGGTLYAAGEGAVTIKSFSDAITMFAQTTLAITASSGTTITSDIKLNGGLKATQDIVSGNISLQLHTHGGVQSGGSFTAKPS